MISFPQINYLKTLLRQTPAALAAGAMDMDMSDDDTNMMRAIAMSLGADAVVSTDAVSFLIHCNMNIEHKEERSAGEQYIFELIETEKPLSHLIKSMTSCLTFEINLE